MINALFWGGLAIVIAIRWGNSESKLKRYFARAFIAFVVFSFMCNLVTSLGIGK